MIDHVDREMLSWIGTVVSGVAVSLLAPGAEETSRGVGLYLLDILQTPQARGTNRPPLQITLRYLVTAWAEDASESHRLLGDLLFSAMERADFELEVNPPDIQVWSAFGTPPRPCFVIRVPVRRERAHKAAPRVRKPLVVKAAAIRELSGRVVGPEDIPLMGAVVEIPGMMLSTETDFDGRFRFPGVPQDPPINRLTVRAKGQTLSVQTETARRGNEPLVIRFPELEG